MITDFGHTHCHQPKKPAITVPPEDMALLNEFHEGAMILV
jgi:hypothetical protein